MRFSRQGYWSELLFHSPGDLSSPGMEPRSPALQADPLLTELQGKPQEYTELYKKDLHDPDNHNGVIIHLEPDILECEVGLQKYYYEQS